MRRERAKLLAEINITPLVDVAITLLIIFMITAPLMRAGVEVSLPKTEAAKPRLDEGLLVTITAQKEIFLEEKPVAVSALEGRLRRMREGRPDLPVHLKADERVPYGFVMEVLGKIKAAGVEALGLVAEPERKK